MLLNQNRVKIGRLNSGGLITSYFCTARCRHCLYNSSPNRSKQHIDEATAEAMLTLIRVKGCRSIHIGGGEPLLRPQRLMRVLDIAADVGMGIEYIETNSAWYRDADSARELLTGLREKGVGTLLISISPFHNESIAYAKVRGVVAACRQVGIGIFPWRAEFSEDLMVFDPDHPHCLSEFEDRFGKTYIVDILRRYWIHMGGRALELYRPLLPRHSFEQIIDADPTGCARDLSDTSHFHIDLYGNYVPGLCAGLAIQAVDLQRPLDLDRYPIISLLSRNGVVGLARFASDRGFRPQQAGYLNKCDLCNDIRSFLSQRGNHQIPELQPGGFYRQQCSPPGQ